MSRANNAVRLTRSDPDVLDEQSPLLSSPSARRHHSLRGEQAIEKRYGALKFDNGAEETIDFEFVRVCFLYIFVCSRDIAVLAHA